MSRYRKWSIQEKSKVALEAVKGDKTIAEVSAMYGVHSNQISKWKKQLLTGVPEIFSGAKKAEKADHRKEVDKLYAQIGKLKVENDFLKKTLYQI